MTIKDKINKNYEIFLNANINHNSNFINTKIELYKLLLDIIEYYNYDDNRFKQFYINYLSNTILKQNYNTILLYPYRKINFNSFDNANDFIDKICSPVSNEDFYKELIEILTLKQDENLKKRRRIE